MTTKTQPSRPQSKGSLLLEVKDLSITFQQGDQITEAVTSVSFSLEKGQTLALVGESGSGKSVSSHAILQLLPTNSAQYKSGEILFKGQNLLSFGEADMRQIRGNEISMIFQEPMTSLNPLHTIERQIGEVLKLHKHMTPPQAKARCLELLELVGIPEPERRLKSYPHELSGGQKQRVMIAMALANQPEILIADEPTTALDVTVQKQVLELISDIQSKLGMAVILISHDLNIVKQYADNVAVMLKGKVVESGPIKEVFENPSHHYTKNLVEAEPSGAPEPIDNSAPELLATQDLSIQFPIKKNFFGKTIESFVAVDKISMKVREGETLGIVGESGSGKTTLGLAIMKLISSEGKILFEQNEVSALNQKQFRPLRREIQIVFQDPFGSLSPRMSIADIIAEGLEIHGIGDAQSNEEQIIQVLKEVDLDPAIRHRYPHEFSGGQRQRIAIARALVLRPKLIILDEPTSALDRSIQVQVIDLLRRIQTKYKLAYIFISHDLAVVKALSHRVLVIRAGKIVEQNECEQLFRVPKEPYTKQLLEAAYFYSSSQ
jgi:microcin C transport system ATP-binding protein